jgi:hypothetical protein
MPIISQKPFSRKKKEPEPKYEYFPISRLIHDSRANEEVHNFFLDAPGHGKSRNIRITEKDIEGKDVEIEYELGIISIAPAPVLPP